MFGIVVAIVAFRLLRTFVDACTPAPKPRRRRSSSPAMPFRSPSRCRSTMRRRCGRCQGVTSSAGPTGSAASTLPKATSSRSSRSMARPISTCIPSSVSSRRNARRSCVDRQGAIAGASSPTSMAGRSAIRFDTRDDLPGHVDVHAAGDLRRRGRQGRRDPVLLPLGLSERDREEAFSAARRPGWLVVGRIRDPEEAAEIHTGSTRRSGTRWRRPSPKPKRHFSWASSR